MAIALAVDPLRKLAHAPASAVKKEGWRGIMRTVAHHGKVVITNHNAPEAVILSMADYTAMAQAAASAQSSTPDALAALRRQFDDRLAALEHDDAGDRLRLLMDAPPALKGQVIAGTGY